MKLTRRIILTVAIALLTVFNSESLWASPPKPAKEILATAQTEAKASGKLVWVLFHASWCGWCHEMENVMNMESVRPVVEKYFVVRWLTVMENPAHKADENPGSQEVLDSNEGKDQGIPFYFFTDAKGKVLANSRLAKGKDGKSTNIGCPSSPEEITAFLEVLKRIVPKITAQELAIVKAGFETIK